MSEQRIDTAADAATSTDTDPGEGLGVAAPHGDPLNPEGAAGNDSELPQPTADRRSTGSTDPGETEGESYLRDTQAKQGGSADLDGRQPGSGSKPGSGSAPGSSSGSGGVSAGRSGTAETGEITAEPSPERREEHPGSVASEFGDRAGTAPADDGHPSI
jgi:hypothetical protein